MCFTCVLNFLHNKESASVRTAPVRSIHTTVPRRASSKMGPISPQHKLSHIQTMLYTLIYYMHMQMTAGTYQHIQTVHPGETRHTGCRNSSVWSCFLERMVTVQKKVCRIEEVTKKNT